MESDGRPFSHFLSSPGYNSCLNNAKNSQSDIKGEGRGKEEGGVLIPGAVGNLAEHAFQVSPSATEPRDAAVSLSSNPSIL